MRSPAKRPARRLHRSSKVHHKFGKVLGGGYEPEGSEREFAALFLFAEIYFSGCFCGSPKSQVADRGLKPQRRSGSNAALKRRSSTGLRIAIYKAAIGRCTRLQLAMRETAIGHRRGRGPPCARPRLVISQGRQLDGMGRQQVPRRFAPRNDKDSKTCRNQSIAALRLVPPAESQSHRMPEP